MTGKEIYRDMTKFWGKLFAINFALGVTTGLTMEFQFGTNWSYYSHYVGDVFGAPLAIEGLMAFFLEFDLRRPDDPRLGQADQGPASGRDLPDRARHQPFGAVDSGRQCLDAESGRLRVLRRDHAHGNDQFLPRSSSTRSRRSSSSIRLPPAMSPPRSSSSAFPPGTSSRGVTSLSPSVPSRWRRRSALPPSLSVIVLGDESGYELGDVQKVKLAAIEAVWETEPRSGPFHHCRSSRRQDHRRRDFAVCDAVGRRV